jgi:subtilisin family serine protease
VNEIKAMRTITSVLLLFGFTLLAEAQQPVRYIVELQTAPVFAPAHRASTAAVLPASPRLSIRLDDESALPAGARRVLADDAEPAAISGRPSPQEQAIVLALVQRQQADFDTHAAALGFRSIRHLAHVANIVVVEGAPGSEATLRGLPNVKRVARERVYHANFDASIALHQIDSAWAAIPGATYNPANPSAGVWNPAGQGVKIGIIDTGIDGTHPAFKAPSMTAPAGFPKYSSESSAAATINQSIISGKIIVARSYGGQGAQDVDGHGTAVAQLAAGVFIPSGNTASANGTLASPVGMTLSGVAPAAWLGIYDVDSQLDGSYSDADILSALNDCSIDGMDVVSMSFGAPDYGGSADPLNQEYNAAFDVLKNLGTVIVASAGNDGPDSNSVAAPAVDPDVIAAGAQQSTTLLGDTNITASNITTPIEAGAADNNTDIVPALTAPLADVTKWDSTGLGCTNGSAWPQAGVAAGKILIVQRGTCNFTVKVQNAQTAGAAALIVYNESAPTDGYGPNALLYMALDSAVSPSALANFPAIFVGYSDGETLRTNLQNGGASYAVTAQFGLTTGDPRQIADFSARGPDADLAIKPELVAVGNSIVTAYCTDETLDQTSNTCSVFGYLFWDGTSFASPLTAGAVALIKSARPTLDSNDYRSLVVNTASPMLDPGGNTWPVQTAGAGSLNVLKGLQSTVTANPVILSFGTAGSTVPTTQEITLKNVGSATTTYNLTYEGMSVIAPSGQTVVAVTVSWGAGSTTLLFPAYNAAATSVYTSAVPATPRLSVDSLTLAPLATANVTATMPTAGLAVGLYQGFIDVTPAGLSSPQARIPYWYAVPAAAPTQIAFDLTPLDISVASGGTGTMILRFVDSSGVVFPAPGTITVTETAPVPATGSATLSTPYPAYSGAVTFPNVWLIDITLPFADPGGTTYTFNVQSGSVSGTFTVVSF